MSTLRIIAGELRGRRIRVPPGSRTRPTADRVREALFSTLGAEVREARVLDAYSGSGALGFEALSRGARRAVFVESDRRALATLRENAARLEVEDRCTFLAGPVVDLLRTRPPGEAFDLILADPPYASDQAERFLPLAIRCLAEGGRLVVERDARVAPASAPRDLELVRSSRYGRNCLDFYRRAAGRPLSS